MGNNLVARTDLGRPLRLILAGHTDTVPANGNLPAAHRRRHAVGPRRHRHEGGPGRHARAGLHGGRARHGRHLRVLRGRGGGGRAQRAAPAVRGAARPPERRRGPARRAHRRRDRGRLPGHPARRAQAGRGAGPHAPGRGWAATPSTAWRPSWSASPPTRAAGRDRRLRVSGRRCRPCGSRVVWPATSCPTTSCSTVNHRFAPDRTLDEAVDARAATCWLRRPRATRSRWSTRARPPRRRSTTRCSPRLIERDGLGVRAKLGWTDVARFAEHGIPGGQLRPGRRHVAHTAGERVEREPIERVYAALDGLLRAGV